MEFCLVLCTCSQRSRFNSIRLWWRNIWTAISALWKMCGSRSFTGQVCVHITYSCRSSLGMIELFLIIYNGNWTEWSAVWSEVLRMILKLCEFDLKSQVWFQTKIAWHKVQLPLYLIQPFWILRIQSVPIIYLFRQVAGCSKVGNAEWARHSIMLTWAAKIINKTNMDVFIEFRICFIFSAHGVSLIRNNCFWQTSQSYVISWSDAKFTN